MRWIGSRTPNRKLSGGQRASSTSAGWCDVSPHPAARRYDQAADETNDRTNGTSRNASLEGGSGLQRPF